MSPYIDPEFRPGLDASPVCDVGSACETKGELTYVLYRISQQWARTRGIGPGYQEWSEAISALADAADELRRRRLHPHEDKKITVNGDVE